MKNHIGREKAVNAFQSEDIHFVCYNSDQCFNRRLYRIEQKSVHGFKAQEKNSLTSYISIFISYITVWFRRASRSCDEKAQNNHVIQQYLKLLSLLFLYVLSFVCLWVRFHNSFTTALILLEMIKNYIRRILVIWNLFFWWNSLSLRRALRPKVKYFNFDTTTFGFSHSGGYLFRCSPFHKY